MRSSWQLLSSLINVTGGVPQDSVLGPYYLPLTLMIFLTFFTGSAVTVKLYVDDAKLCSSIQCADDMHSLQLCLDFVYNWSLHSVAAISVC